jgi:hypothetical protein
MGSWQQSFIAVYFLFSIAFQLFELGSAAQRDEKVGATFFTLIVLVVIPIVLASAGFFNGMFG